jgi:hypothetical protein
MRLNKNVANEVSTLSTADLPASVKQDYSFSIIVADNFDMNVGTLHGENSIHILNRIIVQTPLNDELQFDINDCLNHICSTVESIIDKSNFDLRLNGNITNSVPNTPSFITDKNEPDVRFEDNSYREILFVYTLMKNIFDTNNTFRKIIDSKIQRNIPLLSGFFATYIPHVYRPLSKITFLPPLNQDPSSLATSQLCLQSTSASLIQSGIQKEAIVVVDEKIYKNCIKVISLYLLYYFISKSFLLLQVKRMHGVDNKLIFLYPGDFHIMKNYMIVIWDVLNGSGVEDVLEFIYKGAAHRSVMNVHNFNYSLRSCKLLYTSLGILIIETFIKSLSSSPSSSSTTAININKLKEILEDIPSDFAVLDKKQQWFITLLNEIRNLQLADVMEQWAIEQCEHNMVFKFWYFIFRKILEPLILMYVSTRLSNFDGMLNLLISIKNVCVIFKFR